MLETNTLDQTVVFDSDRVARAYAHVEEMWPILTREQKFDDGTLIGLPYPYVIPSAEPRDGFVFEEMYYWDSYFIAQGLLASGRYDLAEGMLENLLYLMHKLHIIPTANRYYQTGHSQPPFLTSFIFDIYEKCEKNIVWLSERISVAEKEYREVWTSQMHPTNNQVHKGLSRYYDVHLLDDFAESGCGWDHTTRFHGRCLSFVPIDLNSLLYKYETDFARAYDLFNEPDTADVWRGKAALRQQTINDELWNEEKGFYFDLDYQDGTQSDVFSLAALYALWAGVASHDQAERVIQKLNDFVEEGGLSTTLKEQFRDLARHPQWAYPNGWAPLHWLTVKGLIKYGYFDQAEMIARKWLNTNIRYFEEFGVFREAYNMVEPMSEPVRGVYPPQFGFGWTNAVFVDLAKQFLSKDELQKI
jgi:alpha,alpha-trehalase